MAKILGGAQRDALDAAARDKRNADKQRLADLELSLPGWEPAPAPRTGCIRRIVERRHSSGHKITYKLEWNA